MKPMKAISLWEPWASLMMLSAKKIETRGWETKYRGPLLICAAKGGLHLRALRGVLTNEERFKKALAPLVIGPPERDVSIVDLNHGKALCIVDLVDCIPTADLVSTLFPPNPEEIAFGDYTEDRYGWITTNLRRFERPFPIKGGQRIFNVPMEVIEGHALIEGTSASMSSRT